MRITHALEINRQPEDVFAYITDPQKLPTWQPTTVAVERERTGALVLGERFAEIHEALGRETRTTVDVVAYEEPRVFELHVVNGPLPLDGRWELEPTETAHVSTSSATETSAASSGSSGQCWLVSSAPTTSF